MSQNSLVVANGTGAAVRAAANNALNSLVTNNSGSGAPSTTYAYMLWADTTNDLLKIRNAANTGWVTIGRLSLTNLGLSPISRGDLWGMTLSNNGSDATNDIDVAAGSCASDDATDANRVLLAPGALTKQLDAVWAAGNAAGGRISSESLVNGTWHVYAFRRSGGSDDICFSQSLTPTLPDSGTNKRRIGSILRESAAIVGFVQTGRLFMRKTGVQDVAATNPGTAAVTRTLSVPTGIAVDALINSNCVNVGSNSLVWLSPLSINDQAPSGTVAPGYTYFGSNTSTANWGIGGIVVTTNTSGQIRSRISVSDANTVLYINTIGWVDSLGKEF
jgi:hypothetical protein